MEYNNKHEAVRAKEIAERRFIEGKLTSSKKYAIKAQNLCPSLEGLSDLLTTLDVHISAETRISGERDWYAILGVNPLDSNEIVKKQFRKLALTLHPDKNTCTGADTAFRLVSEAWSVLSDKAMRLAYDRKRNLNSGSANGSATSNLNMNTFWTVCNGCRTHYEYLRMYLNHTLLCPNCHEAFFATETAPPRNVLRPTNQNSNPSSRRQHQRPAEKVDKWSKKRRTTDDVSLNGQKSCYVENNNQPGISSITSNLPKGSRELPLFELRTMLTDMARTRIVDKLKEWKKITGNGDERGNHQIPNPTSMNVPDSDFHNFDSDRTKKSFGDDQVWAAYDDNDGMPRYYARIHKILSRKPFKMRFSWLNSRTSTEFGSLDWTGLGFTKTAGDFRTGKFETTGSLNSFSHRVTWTKGARGVVCIYPRKGDVWALYRNWAADWDETTPVEVVHQYDVVEVLDDYSEGRGVDVVPLVKVPGFRAVFRADTEPGRVRTVPREEMFRFSHQVPNYSLSGEEAEKAPEGCRELDPAATPVEFLNVVKEAPAGQF